jgi:hypothetical protein
MGAVVTFGGAVGCGIDIDGVIRTGLHAGFTANTDLRVKLNNPVSPLIHGRDRADTDAGWVGAVVTAGHLKVAFGVGKFPFFNILDPGTVDTQGYFILRLAGCAAGVTTDAGLVIDYETIVHSFLPGFILKPNIPLVRLNQNHLK